MPVQAVIFDIDGTLIDSVDQHAAAWVETFSHFGRSVTFEDVRKQIGKGGDQLMPVFLSDAFIDQHGQEVESFRGDLFKRKYLDSLRPFPCVPALFQRLRAAGARTVLASSAKADEIERYEQIAGIATLVDEAASSDDAENSKPAPDIFQVALEKAGVGPSEAVVIGDSPYDAEAASKAGMKCIGVLCGGFAEADLRAAGYAAIYRDPEDLLRNLDQSILA